MFSSEFIAILRETLRSWQVMAVTVALVIYMYIVFQVARVYRPKSKKVKPKKVKAPPAAEEVSEDQPDSSSNEELGLEEA